MPVQDQRSTHGGDRPDDSQAAPASSRQSHRSRSSRYTPAVTHHARKRWAERAVSTDLTLLEAWERGITVSDPELDCDTARLFAPCDVVFLLRGGAITSTWPANYDSIDGRELGRCAECGNLDRFDGALDSCHWCGSQSASIEMGNGVTVTIQEAE